MSTSKRVWWTLLAAALLTALVLVASGCGKQPSSSTPGSTSTAPSVSTPSSQGGPSGQPSGRPSFNPQQMQANLSKALSGLVANGTITQAQANQVTQAYANRQQGQNPLTALVSNGTLTQAQANAIRQAMGYHGSGAGGYGSSQTNQQ